MTTIAAILALLPLAIGLSGLRHAETARVAIISGLNRANAAGLLVMPLAFLGFCIAIPKSARPFSRLEAPRKRRKKLA